MIISQALIFEIYLWGYHGGWYRRQAEYSQSDQTAGNFYYRESSLKHQKKAWIIGLIRNGYVEKLKQNGPSVDTVRPS